MLNLKATIYYLSESEKIFNGVFYKKQNDSFSESSIIIEKCSVMLHNFLNILMEDELKIISRSTDLISSELFIDGKSFFYNIMKEAKAIDDQVKGNLEDQNLVNNISTSIIDLRFNYLALRSAHPDMF